MTSRDIIDIALMLFAGSLFAAYTAFAIWWGQRRAEIRGFELGRWAGAIQGFERGVECGKEEAKPIRARNGWFVGRPT